MSYRGGHTVALARDARLRRLLPNLLQCHGRLIVPILPFAERIYKFRSKGAHVDHHAPIVMDARHLQLAVIVLDREALAVLEDTVVAGIAHKLLKGSVQPAVPVRRAVPPLCAAVHHERGCAMPGKIGVDIHDLVAHRHGTFVVHEACEFVVVDLIVRPQLVYLSVRRLELLRVDVVPIIEQLY